MRSQVKFWFFSALLVVALIFIGFFVHPPGTVLAKNVQYSPSGSAAAIYDANMFMHRFGPFRSLLNVSYKVEQLGGPAAHVSCPDVSVVRVYTVYGLPWDRFWMGCAESGYLN